MSNSSIYYRQNNNQQNSIVKDLNFVFDEISINSDSLNISLESSSFESNEFGKLKNASLKLNKVYDNIYVDQLDVIYNNYLGILLFTSAPAPITTFLKCLTLLMALVLSLVI